MMLRAFGGIRMDDAEDEKAWITLGDLRVENLEYKNRNRNAFIAKIIELASASLTQNGCAKLLPLKIAPARFDDSRYYDLHITSDLRPTGNNGAFHFIVQRKTEEEETPEAAAALSEELALAASFYMKSCLKWAQEADEIWSHLTRTRTPAGFKLIEIATIVDASGDRKFSAEFDTLEIDLKISRARITGHSKEGVLEKFKQEIRVHNFRKRCLENLKNQGGDIFLDLSAKIYLKIANLSPKDIISLMGKHREIRAEFHTRPAKLEDANFYIIDGILYADFYTKGWGWRFISGNLYISCELPASFQASAGDKLPKDLISLGGEFEDEAIATAELWQRDLIKAKFKSKPVAVKLQIE